MGVLGWSMFCLISNFFGEDRIYYYFNGLPFKCWHFNIGQKWLPTYKELVVINGKSYKDVLLLYSPASDSLGQQNLYQPNLWIISFYQTR
jgi:hypothetical protein